MSREMAFQMSIFQLMEALKKLAGAWDKDGGLTFGEWLDKHIPDADERARVSTALIVADRCQKAGRDIKGISKVIVWRNAEGKPADIQIEFRR